MKLVILSDMHIISPRDEFKEIHEKRAHFAKTWDSLKTLQRKVREESPDLIISTGDLVDWYSDENRDEALDFLDKLGSPWLLTPGNHDIAGYKRDDEKVIGPLSTPAIEEEARRGWSKAGVNLGNRQVEFGSAWLFLLDSSTIDIPLDTQSWLVNSLQTNVSGGLEEEKRFLFTHVPFNIRPIREFLKSLKTEKDPLSSIQKGTPETFEELLVGNVSHIFTGHLHLFPGYVEVKNTAMHLLPLSVVANGSFYPQQGTITVFEMDCSQSRQIHI